MKKHFLLLLAFLSAGTFAADPVYCDMGRYQARWEDSIRDPEAFWAGEASMIKWQRFYTKVWQPPSCDEDYFVGRWFVGGKLNAAENCLDRWASKFPAKMALIWVGEDGRDRKFTYKQLYGEVSRLANLLKKMGIKKKDRVAIWLSMVPEIVVSQLACAKIGAVHSVIFAGFSAENVKERILDAGCSFLITADKGARRGQQFEMRSAIEPYLGEMKSLKHILVVARSPDFKKGPKDLLWDKELALMPSYCKSAAMDSEDPLFILYTSGTTGKPKGIVHSTAGYLIYAMSTMKYAWGIKGLLNGTEDKGELWFCTADIGWITGHSYITYAPLALGVTVLMYEGAPTYPDEGRLFDLIEKYKVTHFYTAPTLIRMLASKGSDFLKKYDLTSLKTLGTVGEPIDAANWLWYSNNVGYGLCPVLDTYWQTETGGYLITPLSNITKLKPGSCALPFFGIEPQILNKKGELTSKKGSLCINKPWPGIARTIYNDHQRFLKTYLKPFEGRFFTGDGAIKDKDGYFWILGRLDDVIKVSGHRIGPAEVEGALTSHPAVAEAAVIPVPHAIKGEAIFAFAVLKDNCDIDAESLIKHVKQKGGAFLAPEKIIFVPELPKTRSGKIMRRILKALFKGDDPGNISTLANPDSVAKIAKILSENCFTSP